MPMPSNSAMSPLALVAPQFNADSTSLRVKPPFSWATSTIFARSWERASCGAGTDGWAELEEAGKLKAVITQNIDNLHERAGNRRVIHMHGELLKVRCSWSGQVLEWTGDVTAEDKCHCCQFPAALRPHVVWFGEMPLGMDEIYSALADADIFIAIGTSGHVYPAAGFVHEARLHGAHTVELNLEPSQVGSEFAEKHYGLASEVVPAFIDKLLQENAL